MIRDKENIVKVQLQILQRIEVCYNYLIELSDKAELLKNESYLLFIKKLVQKEIVICFSTLFESKEKFSFFKLYNVLFCQRISIEQNIQKCSSQQFLECKIAIAALSFNEDIKIIRDKFVAHIDVTDNPIQLSYKKIHLLLEDSKKILTAFCKEIDFDISNISFNEKELNEVIGNQIHINKGVENIVIKGKGFTKWNNTEKL